MLLDSDRFLKWMLHGGTNHLSKASVRLILHFIERRSVTSHHHGSTIFGWQQNQRQGRRKERGKKVKGFYWKKQICTCIMLFCSFLCRGCTTATWNFLISSARFMESVNQLKNFRFPFSKLRYGRFENKIDEVWSGADSLFGEFSVCCHPKNLLPRQRDVTTSPLYSHYLSFYLPNLPKMSVRFSTKLFT